MREFMEAEGMVKPEDWKDVNRNDVTDIRSSRRLGLIFDTNVRQAYGFGKWRQGMSPAVRKAFPAARFIREHDVGEARPRHAVSEGDVQLKTDYEYWAKFQNDPEIGGFGVPWGPYGFNSGMGQEDVSREDAERLGLVKPGAPVTPPAEPEPAFNDSVWANIGDLDPELKKELVDSLEKEIEDLESMEDIAKREAAKARRSAMQRSERKAIQRGDLAEAARIRKLIDLGVPEEPLIIDDNRIALSKRAAERAPNVEDWSRQAAEIFSRIERKLPAPQKRGVSRARHLGASEFIATPEEKLIVESPLEIMVAHDASGRIYRAGVGGRASIKVPDLPAGSIVTHNHPGGRGPSDGDFKWVFMNADKILRVITRNERGELELFRFKAGPQFDPAKVSDLLASYAILCRRGGDTAPARRAAMGLIQRDFPGMLALDYGIVQ
ncbi:hypothetical protein [Luteolibacter luteus]|uniref:Uncharacterized protein n=1 Tax=Luteolibacter luteus TaxID=2728835 RepID=A0A858RGY9_9BACT|nr:hypothetical protein [Luteolibacter luteus]QJE95965.1 hypothetical protein HHL09_09280 [Luteolibacter luteus]